MRVLRQAVALLGIIAVIAVGIVVTRIGAMHQEHLVILEWSNKLVSKEIGTNSLSKFLSQSIQNEVSHNVWVVSGEVAFTDERDEKITSGYSAVIRQTCVAHGAERCWVLQSLELGGQGPTAVLASTSGSEADMEIQVAENTVAQDEATMAGGREQGLEVDTTGAAPAWSPGSPLAASEVSSVDGLLTEGTTVEIDRLAAKITDDDKESLLQKQVTFPGESGNSIESKDPAKRAYEKSDPSATIAVEVSEDGRQLDKFPMKETTTEAKITDRPVTETAPAEVVSTRVDLYNMALAHSRNGRDYFKTGDYANAIREYRVASKFSPGLVSAHYGRGEVHFRKADYTQAVGDFTSAIKLAPDYPFAYYWRGVANKTLGKIEEAILDFTHTIRLKADYAPAYNFRAKSLASLGYHRDALRDSEMAISLAPDIPSYLATHSLILAALGRNEGAFATLERAMSVADADWIVQYQQAMSREGYYQGPIDGLYGPSTRSAMRACLDLGCDLVASN